MVWKDTYIDDIGGICMKIQDMAVTDIHPYSGNPRYISDESIQAVAHSIEEFGFQVADFAADTSLDDYEEPVEPEEVVYECPHCHMGIPKSKLKKAGGD